MIRSQFTNLKLAALIIAVLFFLDCEGINSGRLDAQVQSSTPRPEQAKSAYRFVNSIGVNVHLNYFDRLYGNFELVKRELHQLGVLHVRDGAHLQSPDYNQAVYSRWVRLGALGVRFNAVLDPRSGLGPLSPEKLEQIDNLAGGTIESFEGPNELDISGMKDWPSVLHDYQASIWNAAGPLRAQQKLAIIGPSLASAANGAKAEPISQYADYGNLHPYPGGKDPSDIFPRQLELARELSGDKPVIVTETGYHDALNDHRDQPAVSEAAAAKYIPRIFLENFSHGIVRTYLYEFLDEAANPAQDDEQLHWGLVRNDGTEKPSFHALENLVAETQDGSQPSQPSDLSYALDAGQHPLHHLLLQKSSGQFVLILWQPATSYDRKAQHDIQVDPASTTLTLQKNAKSILAYEPAMSASPLHRYSDVRQIVVNVSDDPLVLQIDLQ